MSGCERLEKHCSEILLKSYWKRRDWEGKQLLEVENLALKLCFKIKMFLKMFSKAVKNVVPSIKSSLKPFKPKFIVNNSIKMQQGPSPNQGILPLFWSETIKLFRICHFPITSNRIFRHHCCFMRSDAATEIFFHATTLS